MTMRVLLPLSALALAYTACHTATVIPATEPAAASGAASAVTAVAPAAIPFWPADGRFPGRGQVSGWTEFPKHNAGRRALFAARQAEEKDGLVFVGDSITEGWHTLAQDLADLGIKVVNRGIGGDTTPNLLYRLEEDVLSLQPRALVLLIGTNDLGQNTSADDIMSNLREVHARIRARYPNIPVALCTVMPRGDGERYATQILQLNQRIREFAARDPKITLCDTFGALALPDGSYDPSKFVPDKLHLNANGYAAWRDAIKPILKGWNLAATSR